MNQTDKAEKRSVSAPSSLWRHAEEAARAEHQGKVSGYIKSLMEADAKGNATVPKPRDISPLLQLFVAFLPALEPDIEDWLKLNDINESVLISDMLLALADYANDHKALDRGQPRRFYICDKKPVVFAPDVIEAELSEEDTTMLSDWLAGKRESLIPSDPSLNELSDSKHIFQNKKRNETPADRAALDDWLKQHPDEKAPLWPDVEEWLIQNHPKAKRNMVHLLLQDRGIRCPLPKKRAKRPESEPSSRRKAR